MIKKNHNNDKTDYNIVRIVKMGEKEREEFASMKIRMDILQEDTKEIKSDVKSLISKIQDNYATKTSLKQLEDDFKQHCKGEKDMIKWAVDLVVRIFPYAVIAIILFFQWKAKSGGL